MKSLLLFLSLCAGITATCTLSFAQPDSLWSHTYGRSGNEFSYSAVQAQDGGYVLGAQINPGGGGNWDAWLIKTNALGDTTWCRAYGGTGWECGYNIGRTAEGGYFIAGSTDSYGTSQDYWLVKTDADGNAIWDRTYGGAGEEQLFSGKQTADSGFVLAGYTYSYGAGGRDFWLVKTDADGEIQWNRTFGGQQHDGASAGAIQTADGGYMVAGVVRSLGEPNGDFWLIKLNANGDSVWSHPYGGPRVEIPYCVRQTADGGYIITGYTTQSNGFTDAWLLKTDANGDSLWSVTYGNPNTPEVGLSVVQTDDGGYAVAGGREWNTSSGVGDAWMFRTDSNGNILWDRTFGGPAYDMAYDIQRTTDGGYLLAGLTTSFGAGNADAWMIKTGPDVGSLEGGETCATATEIPGIPFMGAGNTSDNVDDYNPPFAWPGGRDVVYRYTPAINQCVDISLCGSSFDTRLYVYHGVCSGVPFRINDDACPSGTSLWTSELSGVNLVAGETYYVVVDGYEAASSGNYVLQITTCGPPWVPDQPCQDNALFGQPHMNDAYGFISDNTWPWNNVCLHDNFSGLSQDICAVEFWGVTNTSNQQPCTEDPLTFEIVFHTDSAGYPGAVVANYQFVLSREAAGVYYGYPVWKYTTALDPCVTLADGWMSIQAVSIANPCYFAWVQSPVGDCLDWQFVNGVPAYRTYTDHAFCLMASLAANPTQSTLPTQYALHQNYPNPFNPTTTISYDLPKAGNISLRVFDLLGREVALLKNGFVEAGTHHVMFNGSGLASGMYFARLDAGKFSQTKKLMLLK
jgi:hypothetical protein